MKIERIDNNQGYDPFNCRWATQAEQSRNTRRNPTVVYKDLAAAEGIKYPTLMNRKRAGTDLTAPVRQYRRGGGHGTISRYIRLKCRCEPCRTAYREYQKARR